ncbi:hypothetical protein Pint_09183 [Pistacia integerrima]|uniref:Uncharacterized protein n=1 Tax=Pistacia integerrima TaxID=434235 RepID=A0ACC0XUR6_9ROSI|nr:hypothetical protein Pint_09183 [Pistacia integerrima]
MALKVLSALDTAKTQYYHFKAIIIAGMGLFTDAYDLFCIPPIMILIQRIYYDTDVDNKKPKIPRTVVSTMVGIALLGTVIGQLIFGRLGDRIGRRRVYGLALRLMVLSSIGCGFSICTTKKCVLGSLGFFRFLLGVGIGGDYPLSATIMSEFANKRTRGTFIAAVFSMQGFGILASSMVTMVVCKIFERASNASGDQTPPGTDIAWRLILMLGSIPAALTYYWRMMMPETARYTALVEQNVLQAAKDMEKVLDVSMSQIAEEFPLSPKPPSYNLLSRKFIRQHGRDLFACSTSWFLVDIVFYSSNLFQSKIYHNYVDDDSGSSMNAFEEAFRVARLQAIVAICSTVPGYYVTVYFIDRIGRVRIQLLGFFCMAIVYLAIGIPYIHYWDTHTNFGFMFLYGLTFFFANFGPNTTTFIVPAEFFPARFRSTCHGISGAIGKVGAIIGSVGLLWVWEEDKKTGDPKATGMTKALILLGGVCFMGMAVTYFFTRETMGRSLEENENEDDSSELCFFRCFNDSCLRTNSSTNEGDEAPLAIEQL